MKIALLDKIFKYSIISVMTEPPPQWLNISFLVVLLFLSMIFSSGETAYLSVNKLKIKYLREKKNKQAARVEKILHNKQKFLTSTLIGNSLVNILISVILTAVTVERAGSNGLGIAVTAATIAILIFGEILPKSVALIFAEPITLKFSAFITAFMFVLSPIERLLSRFTSGGLKLFGINLNETGEVLTDADLKDFFDTSEERGALRPAERDVLEKILSYGDTSIKNIMTPRPGIVALQTGAAFDEIINLSRTSGFSRFPVYENGIDEICGIFYIKDCLLTEEFGSGEKVFAGKTADAFTAAPLFDIKKYLRKPVFVFENTELSKLQEIFKTEKQNMVIVIDEYGGTRGIATVEDLNEEIFGNIADEYDADDTALDDIHFGSSEQEENAVHVIAGNVQLADLNEELGTAFSSEYYDTIGGLIMEKCGEVPALNSSVQIENYIFTVTKTDGNRIAELTVNLCREEE